MLTKIKSLAIFAGINGFSQVLGVLGKGHMDPFFKSFSILQTTAALAFGIQFAVFIPAYVYQTERFFDLTGSLTYLLCTCYSLYAGSVVNGGLCTFQSKVVSILVATWALRLGSFLFNRILQDGKDTRFDELKPDFFRFLNVWALQGLWVFLTALPVFITNASQVGAQGLSPLGMVGVCVWTLGFGIESVADYQKRYWRSLKDKQKPFIDYGLWYYSRHPNYFGEITLWTGMFLICCGSFKGSQHIGLLSPLFVYTLLNYVSGVPLLEKSSDKKYGHLKEYSEYKSNTNCLVPWFKKSKT